MKTRTAAASKTMTLRLDADTLARLDELAHATDRRTRPQQHRNPSGARAARGAVYVAAQLSEWRGRRGENHRVVAITARYEYGVAGAGLTCTHESLQLS